MKKAALSLLMFLGLSFSLNADCYSEWYAAYSSAESRLAFDMARCQYSSWPSRCSYEAQLSFGVAVELAGRAYYDCIHR